MRCYRHKFRNNATGRTIEIDAYRNTKPAALRSAWRGLREWDAHDPLATYKLVSVIYVAESGRYLECKKCRVTHGAPYDAECTRGA